MYEGSTTLPGRAINAMANDKRPTIPVLTTELHQALGHYDELIARLAERTNCLRNQRPESNEGPTPGIPAGSAVAQEIGGAVTRLQAYNRRLDLIISEFDV